MSLLTILGAPVIEIRLSRWLHTLLELSSLHAKAKVKWEKMSTTNSTQVNPCCLDRKKWSMPKISVGNVANWKLLRGHLRSCDILYIEQKAHEDVSLSTVLLSDSPKYRDEMIL